MVSVPLAVFAVLILAMFLAGLVFINVIIGNYLLALICILAICGLGLAVGMLVGCNGTRLDNIDHHPGKGGLDLSEDALRGLKEIPEGAIVATVPPAFDDGIAGKVMPAPEPVTDAEDSEETSEKNSDDFGDDPTARAKHLDEILPIINEGDGISDGGNANDASEDASSDDDGTSECDVPVAIPAESEDDTDNVTNDDSVAEPGEEGAPAGNEAEIPPEDGGDTLTEGGEETSLGCSDDETVMEGESDAEGSSEEDEVSDCENGE
jgi:hypothetical protein